MESGRVGKFPRFQYQGLHPLLYSSNKEAHLPIKVLILGRKMRTWSLELGATKLHEQKTAGPLLEGGWVLGFALNTQDKRKGGVWSNCGLS